MNANILYISTPSNRSFAEALTEVVTLHGKLDISSWQELTNLSSYSIIILDAGVLTEPGSPDSLTGLLEVLKELNPKASIVVTTASATWKRTREALLAGAVDYIRQTLDREILHNYLNPILDKYLSKDCNDEE